MHSAGGACQYVLLMLYEAALTVAIVDVERVDSHPEPQTPFSAGSGEMEVEGLDLAAPIANQQGWR
jgi:hypothetical protein